MNLHILEKLDYGLYSDKQRIDLTRTLLDNLKEPVDLENTTEQKQIEGLANYILYGKEEESDKSIVDKKNVYIKPKYNSFQKKEPESLEALQESITFNEVQVRPFTERNIYTKPKQKIDREKDAWIPGMEGLWEIIDQMQDIYDYSKIDASAASDDFVEVDLTLENQREKLTGLRLYKWRHWLIDIRRHQFYLKDSYKPTIHFVNIRQNAHSVVDWESDSSYLTSTGERHIVREHVIDFTNPLHIYYLLEHYSALKQQVYDDLSSTNKSQMPYILYSLEELIDKTNLSVARRDILIWKVDKFINRRICQFLKEKHGLDYNENYISTIWKKEICGKIAAQADLEIDKFNARYYAKAWKQCRCCGIYKLRDEREFVKKNTSADGLSNRCKVCDKKFRDEGKKGAVKHS